MDKPVFAAGAVYTRQPRGSYPRTHLLMSRVPDNANNRSVAAILLREGGVIAFPTDTVYGLGAIVFKAGAVSSLFVMKARPRDLPLPVLVASESQLREVAREIPEYGTELAKRFWPGPLTLVLPRHPMLPSAITGGGDTVAVRLPDHPAPQAIISACGAPITGTSANKHGGPEPRTAGDTQRQLGNRLSLVLDGGPSPIGVPSTVVDLTTSPPTLVREGPLSLELLLEECPTLERQPVLTSAERAG